MNIKAAEELSGVSRQNIRFYEREGLLNPDRNPENDYREYQQEHIETLKMIRVMRMLDMPLDQIKLVLEGSISPAKAAKEQRQKLKAQQEQLSAAIRFCEEWSAFQTMEAVNVDEMISRMESSENVQGLFQKWVEDYRKVVLAEEKKLFTFIPDQAVTDPREFTEALFAYAEKNSLNLVITKESMYPEFTIDGIEYTAERVYNAVRGIPVATIRCKVKYPEDFEPDVPENRKKLMKLLNLGWWLIPAVAVIFIVLAGRNVSSPLERWLMGLGVAAITAVGLYRTWLFHFNEKQ
ncbi:MAG: MerR family transcriptional regulator [Oscillospiraceae bacterium]|jgi:DNA-binding transcriptional MerR regulator|nr:MerR family transcriptional regulator [Oscillospiraceae bacterium]